MRAAAFSLVVGAFRSCGGVLIASVKAFRVLLTTSVASVNFSLGDSGSVCSFTFAFSLSASLTLDRDVGARVVLFFVGFAVALGTGFEFPGALGVTFVLEDNKSLSKVTVAGVHVVVEDIAARTASADCCDVFIMIEILSRKKQYYWYLDIIPKKSEREQLMSFVSDVKNQSISIIEIKKRGPLLTFVS